MRVARQRNQLTQRRLAQLVGLVALTINRYETGKLEPPKETAERIATELGYPLAFFYGDDLDEVVADAASFRSMSSMLAREKNAALAAGSIAFLLGDWIERLFELPEPSVVDLRSEKPEAAARMLRQIWSLGEQPIPNMLRLAESKGIRVFSLAENTRKVDAFSLWRSDMPYVFLNTKKTPEHNRMDLAHELGHLVLHRHGAPRGRQAEDEANAFAGEFLMPAADVLAEIPRVYSLEHLISAKSRWRVSLPALNYRVHKLGITSDWQYRSFCIQLSQAGLRATEVDGIAPETSSIWQKVLEMLRGEGLTKPDIARELALPVQEIEKLVFGLTTMMTIEGGRKGAGGARKKGRPAGLRLIDGNTSK